MAADGIAGPETLARMQILAEITEKVVEMSQVPASTVEGPSRAEAPVKVETPARRSIWDTVKSFERAHGRGGPAREDLATGKMRGMIEAAQLFRRELAEKGEPEMAAKKARRTTHRSVSGKKLYAVRDATGRFKDIQTYERAHRADLAKRTAGEKTAARKRAAKKRKG